MKKTLVALAAFAAASAFAQSSVTIYGVMDVGVNKTSATDADDATTKVSAANVNGALASNRLGFKGTEDIGGGLKADFVYELGLDAGNTGALTTATARQSWAGLTGSMGQIQVGRNYNPAFLLNIALDAGAANNLSAGRTVYGNGPITTARSSGLATYTTPTMAGFTAKLSSGTNETDTAGEKSGTNVSGGSLVYANGPLMAAYGFNKINAVNAAGDKDETIMGATYDLGKAKLLLSVGDSKTKDADGAQSASRKATQMGVRYPFGAIDTFATYGTAKVGTTEGEAETKSKGYQAGAIYNLSKRTGLYTIYGQSKNKEGSVKNSELAVGVRHSY
jgi:predicted porin